MEFFGKFITVILLGVLLSILQAFVFCKLWIWFIVPTFEMQPLRIIEAIGILFLIGFIKTDLSENKKDWNDIMSWILTSTFFIFFMLFIGWIVSQFM